MAEISTREPSAARAPRRARWRHDRTCVRRGGRDSAPTEYPPTTFINRTPDPAAPSRAGGPRAMFDSCRTASKKGPSPWCEAQSGAGASDRCRRFHTGRSYSARIILNCQLSDLYVNCRTPALPFAVTLTACARGAPGTPLTPDDRAESSSGHESEYQPLCVLAPLVTCMVVVSGAGMRFSRAGCDEFPYRTVTDQCDH